MKRLILHVGLEKTGTTSFQAFCAENRDRLGALYPMNRACFLNGNHAPLAASYFSPQDAQKLMIAGRSAERAEAVAALRTESAGAPVTLVSAEHFSSRFDPGRIAALREDFGDYEVTLAVVVRHPLARAVSAYATTVASGRGLTLDDFVAELCEPGNPYLLHRPTLEPWAAVFGRDSLVVVAHREGEDIVPALGSRLLADWPQDLRKRRCNRSPTAAQIEQRRRANASSAGRLETWVMRRLGRLATGGRPELTPAQSRRIAEATADDLDWLKSEYGVAFSGSDTRGWGFRASR